MSTTVHIPLSGLPDAQSLSDRLRGADEVVLETAGESYRFTRGLREPGRTAAEMLVLLRNHGDSVLDDQWSSDMTEILRENRAHDRDSWAQ